MLQYIHWNIAPEIFSFHGFALRYYSLMFALAFLCGIWILQSIYTREATNNSQVGKLFIYIAVGTLAGARLGDCLFYDWGYYQHHIAEIFLPLQLGPGSQVRFTGYQGLASHGGAIGILLATLLYCKKYKVNLFWLLDRLVIAVALAGFFIRIGNLFNSEIIGSPTKVPWAFVFESVDAVPRHPSQLYEAFCYLIIFTLLACLYQKGKAAQRGYLFSIFLITVFSARIIIEFWKQNQEAFENAMLLDMGQLLSIPFIILGIYLQPRIYKKSTTQT